jgi:hypothetical protein
MLFSDLGLGAAIVQRVKLEKRHLDTAFWISAWKQLQDKLSRTLRPAAIDQLEFVGATRQLFSRQLP